MTVHEEGEKEEEEWGRTDAGGRGFEASGVGYHRRRMTSHTSLI